MRLQGGSKCAFCERKLESEEFGKGEFAVEHFRPKANVKAWPLPDSLGAQGVSLAEPPSGKGGYYLLAFDIFNYSAACIPCNSALKRDYFPVAAAHNLSGGRPEDLLSEQPLLLYPIGDFDDDPEDAIYFYGYLSQPVAASGHLRRRALVTIEFFQLNSQKRKNLLVERARVLVGLYPSLEVLAGAAKRADKLEAQEVVDAATSAAAPHANCARSFRKLYARDADEARELFHLAVRLIRSVS
jgi:hypothetical protein